MKDWAYLVTAPNQVVAEMWQDMLQGDGIASMLQPQDAVSFLGVSARPVRLLVADDKLEAAKTLLAEWEKADSDPNTEEDGENSDAIN